MKKKLIFCLLLLLFCYFCNALMLDYKILDRKIFLVDKPINLDTSLILLNDYTLISLHDLAKAIGAKVAINRLTREHFFSSKDKKNIFAFVPNDNFIELNGEVLKMPVIAPELLGRVYIPLAFILRKIGYDVILSKQNYYITKAMPKPKVVVKKDDYVQHIPKDLKVYQPETVKDPITVKEIPKETEKVVITSNETYISTGRKEFYLRENQTKDIRIYELNYYQKEKDKDIVQILTTARVTPNIFKLISPNRIVIDFENTILDTPTNNIEVNKALPIKIRLGQFTTSSARIVLEVSKNYALSVFEDSVVLELADFILEQKVPIKEIKKEKVPSKPKSFTLKDKKIAVMAGHGGLDPGAIGVSGVFEKDFTLDTAKRLRDILREKGAKVIMVRERDESMSLKQRVDSANEAKADIAISLHFNASSFDHFLGIETYYYKDMDKLLADIIHKNLVQELNRPDKLVRQVQFYELAKTNMPTVLIEPAYLSNKWEELLIRNESFRQKIAEAVAFGIEEYFKNVK